MIGEEVTKVSTATSTSNVIVTAATVFTAAASSIASHASLDREMAVSCGNKAENQEVNNESIMVVAVVVGVCQTSMSFRKHHEGQFL